MSRDPCVTVALLLGATHVERAGGVTGLYLHGEHDASNATELSNALRRAVNLAMNTV